MSTTKSSKNILLECIAMRSYWLKLRSYIKKSIPKNINTISREKMNNEKNKTLTFDELENYNKISDGILPSPAILESYEEISPGFVEKIVDVIKKEQEHRHQFEQNQLKSYQETLKFSKYIVISAIIGSIFVVGDIPIVALYLCTFLFVLIINIRSHKAYQRASLNFKNINEERYKKDDKQEFTQEFEKEGNYSQRKRKRNRRRTN